MKDYAIIYNPTSAAGKSQKGLTFACQTLDSLGISYELHKTEYAGHAIPLASELAKAGYRVIAAGGDGTCNEVLHGVISSNSKALCGFIPLGSGNDIPAAIGIRSDVKRACEILKEAHTNKFDIGLATTDKGVKRYFLGIGSQGFDALVTQRTNQGKKHLNGTWNYIVSVVRTVASWKNYNIKVTMDHDTYEGPANLVAVGNGPSYGGFMYMCPPARVHDGQFRISVIDIGKIKLLIEFKKLYDASLMPANFVHEYNSKKVRIEMKNPTDKPYICQVDGEILNEIPVNYENIPDGYEFIAPKEDEVAIQFKEKYGRYFYDPRK